MNILANKKNSQLALMIPVVVALLALMVISFAQAKVVSVPANGLTPTPNVEQFFVTPGKTAILTWTDPSLAKNNISQLHYVIRNYWFQKVPGSSGLAKVGKNGRVTAYVKLPNGFYTIDFPEKHQRFGIVSIPAFNTKYDHADSFFAIDSALSQVVTDFDPHWAPRVLYKDVKKVREGLIRILKRSGVSMARARLNWSKLHPSKDKWNWETHWHYDSTRKAYQRIGVPVLGFLPKVPGFLQRKNYHNRHAYASDMTGLYGMVAHVARRWHGAWGALELWNEPNFFKVGHPASQYAAMIKTVAYAIHKHYPDIQVGGPALTGFNVPLRYTKYIAASGALDVMDFLSFHDYAFANAIQTQITSWRKVLKKSRRQDIPLFITESGRLWTIDKNTNNLRPKAGHQGANWSGGAQGAALDDAMRAIEAKACGVARFFAFLYPFSSLKVHADSDQNWGMMGSQGSPLPQMAAYSEAIFLLAHHQYIGDLPVHDDSIRRARVFAKGAEAVVVLYTGRKIKHDTTVNVHIKYKKVLGIDGRTLKVKQAGQIPVPDGLTYIITTRKAVTGHLIANTPAMRLYHIGHAPDAKTHDSAAPVVLQFWPDRKILKPMNGVYFSKRHIDFNSFKAKVRVVNLSDKTCHINLKLYRQQGRHILDTNRMVEIGNSENVTVQPMSYKTVTYPVKVSAGQGTINLRATADFKNGDSHAGPIQPLVVSIHSPVSLKSLLIHYPNHHSLPIEQTSRWKTQQRIFHPAYKTSITTRNGILRLTVFPPRKGKSSQMFFNFKIKSSSSIDLSKVKGIIIRAQALAGVTNPVLTSVRYPQIKNTKAYKAQIMVNLNNPNWYAVYLPINAFKGKSNRFTPMDHTPPPRPLTLNHAKSLTLRIRFKNRSKSKPATFKISDLYLVY